MVAVWGLSLSTEANSDCFKYLFFQGLLEQSCPTEYSMAWFIQLSANAIGIKISQYHPLSIVESPNAGSYFSDACFVYTPSLDVVVPLPSCDLMMCQYLSGSPNPLSPLELYMLDEYHMNHWTLLCQTSPQLGLGQFPLVECKHYKVSVQPVQKFSCPSVVEEDQESCNTATGSFGVRDGFETQNENEEQVWYMVLLCFCFF